MSPAFRAEAKTKGRVFSAEDPARFFSENASGPSA